MAGSSEPAFLFLRAKKDLMLQQPFSYFCNSSLFDILIKFVTSKVLKNVTIGLGAFIQSSYADALVVS